MGLEHMSGVSIIMPAYNSASTIGRAVDSVLAQSYPNWELIVVDDGSRDQTVELVKAYIERDRRIKLLQNAGNMGVAETRNRGIQCAVYPLIAFLDSDDMWEAEKLSRQVSLFAAHPNSALCYTGSGFVNEKGTKSDYILRVPNRVSYKELLCQNVISCSSVLARRGDLLEYGMPDRDMIHEDYAVWLGLLKKYPYAVGIDEPLLIYQVSGSSKSGRKLSAARMQWNTYRHCNVATCSALFYFCIYAVRGIKKHSAIRSGM